MDALTVFEAALKAGRSYLGAVRQAYRDAKTGDAQDFYDLRFGKAEEGGEALEPALITTDELFAMRTDAWDHRPPVCGKHYPASCDCFVPHFHAPDPRRCWCDRAAADAPAAELRMESDGPDAADAEMWRAASKMFLRIPPANRVPAPPVGTWEFTEGEQDLLDLKPGDMLAGAVVGPPVPAAGVVPTPNPPTASDDSPSGAVGTAIESFDEFIRCYVDQSLHGHFADNDDNAAEYVRRAIRAVGVTPTPKPAGTGEK